MTNRLKLNEAPRDFSVRSGIEAIISSDITMELDEYGQYQAVVKSETKNTIFNDPKLATVNAMSDASANEDEVSMALFGKIPKIHHDKLLGYYQDLYVGYVKEGDYRSEGSSGGITTWLLKELLERKKIDGVIHVKKALPSSGKLFEYQISRSVKEIINGAKTRYYPAELSSALSEVKRKKGRYAVVGIPSIIMEVRLLAMQDPVIAERIAYTVGLICGHQKSTKYAENIAWQCGIKPGEPFEINFRKKVKERPASDYVTEVTGIINGKKTIITKSQGELFGVNWGHGFFKTQFSDYTDDTFNETADVSLGDAWLQEYVRDSGGNNVVIVRDSDIATIMKQGIRTGKLKLDSVEKETIIRSQSGLVHHTRDELPYRLHKRDTHKQWRPIKRLEASPELPFLRKRIQDIRMQIAQKSHIKYKVAVEREDWGYFKKSMQKYTMAYKALYYIALLSKNGPVKTARKVIKRLAR